MATTNTSLATTAATTRTRMMNELARHHGPIEMCCENDTASASSSSAPAAAASASTCTGTLVGLLPCGSGSGTVEAEGQFSLRHVNDCQQQQQQLQHPNLRKLATSSSCTQPQHNKRQPKRRRCVPPFSISSSLLLIVVSAPILALSTLTRQAGFFVQAQVVSTDPSTEWPSFNATGSLIPTVAPTPRPAVVPSPRPGGLFPIFWIFEPTSAPVKSDGNGGGGDEDNDADEDDEAEPTPAPTGVFVPESSGQPTFSPVWQPPAKTPTQWLAPTPQPFQSEIVTPSPLMAQPSAVPSLPPVAAVAPPTLRPTRDPTIPPTTPKPTTITPYPTVSMKPTTRPSPSPLDIPTRLPSAAPTPVPVPTTTPTLQPTLGIQSHDVDTVMKMTSMASKIVSGIDWESATESHIKLSIQNHIRNLDPPMVDLEVETDITRQDFFPSTTPATTTTQESTNNTTSRGLRRVLRGSASLETDNSRQLQSEADPQPLQVQFVVRVRFRSEELLSAKYVSDLVGDAFNSDEERALYIERLQKTTNNGYPYLTTVDLLVDGRTPIEEPDAVTKGDDDDNGVNDSTLWIIIGAAGGGFLAIVALGFLACRRIGAQEQLKRTENGGGGGGNGGDNYNNGYATNQTASNSTAVKLGVSTEILVERQDDVSTLGDPVFGNGMMGDHDGGERDEQTASVGNDYDYSKQYLRAQGISGSLVTDNSRDRLMSADSGRSSFTSNKLGQPVAPSVFSDDASFDQHFDHIATEQRFDVTVPPGKLGMVVDTPNGGCPVVHAIKTESILANRVQVGDRLVAVDSEDVTAMTAVQVSKLISLRSDQDRKLVFVRFISPEAMIHHHSNYSNGQYSNHGNNNVSGSALLDDEEEEKEPNMLGP